MQTGYVSTGGEGLYSISIGKVESVCSKGRFRQETCKITSWSSPKSGFYDTALKLTTDPVQENISNDFMEVDSLRVKRPCDTSGESSEELHASKKKRADSLRVKRPRDTLGESSEELHASKKKRV